MTKRNEVLAIRLERAGATAYLTIEGDLDLSTRASLVEVCSTLATDRVSDLRVDCAGIYFIDCVGMTALVQIQERFREGGGVASLTNIDDGPICRLIDLLRLERHPLTLGGVIVGEVVGTAPAETNDRGFPPVERSANI